MGWESWAWGRSVTQEQNSGAQDPQITSSPLHQLCGQGALFAFTEPRLFHLKNGDNRVSTSWGCWVKDDKMGNNSRISVHD